MISSAGQLGTGALSRTGDVPSVARAELRLLSETPNPRVVRFAESSRWSRGTRVAARSPLELASNVAGNLTVQSFRPEGESVSDVALYRHQQMVASRVDMLGSTESRREDWLAGSFARATAIRPVAEPDVFVQVHPRVAEAAEEIAGSGSTPYVSVIWALVEGQQLRKARALLQLIPDSPEFMKLKKLLSVPSTKVSQRQDFDRAREYQWLAKNAKNYVGKWVAVSGDSLIAAADTLKDLRQGIKKAPLMRSPLLHYVE